jgi:hypothetical protein
MFKHIIGQAIYQLTILSILVFYAERFIPEFEDSLDDELKRVQARMDNDPEYSAKYREDTHTEKALEAKYHTVDGGIFNTKHSLNRFFICFIKTIFFYFRKIY